MKTLVMIHGMWGGNWYWDNFINYFSGAGYKCLAPNLRYHDSRPGSEPDLRLGVTSILDYADDLAAEINRLDQKPILIGHSMGGLLAQILASRQLAAAAVLLTPASPAGINALKPSVVKTFWSVMKRWGFWKEPMLIPYSAAAYSILNALSLEEQQEKYAQFVHESGRAASEIGFYMLDRHRAAQVDETKVNCPLLVIGAGKDKITPRSITKKIAKKYGETATYIEYPDNGHWLMQEKGWQKAAGAINQWIAAQGI